MSMKGEIVSIGYLPAEEMLSHPKKMRLKVINFKLINLGKTVKKDTLLSFPINFKVNWR
jgi:hypothetical protein